MSGGLKLLLDTNVWLDYLFPDRPASGDAFSLVDAACAQQAQLFVPATSLKDIFYIAVQILRRDLDVEGQSVCEEVAGAMVDTVGELAAVVPLDLSDVWIARKERVFISDFEDALVCAAAMRADVDYLVTSDKKLIVNARVAALTPQRCLALLEQG